VNHASIEKVLRLHLGPKAPKLGPPLIVAADAYDAVCAEVRARLGAMEEVDFNPDAQRPKKGEAWVLSIHVRDASAHGSWRDHVPLMLWRGPAGELRLAADSWGGQSRGYLGPSPSKAVGGRVQASRKAVRPSVESAARWALQARALVNSHASRARERSGAVGVGASPSDARRPRSERSAATTAATPRRQGVDPLEPARGSGGSTSDGPRCGATREVRVNE
jgi:hypothetical protein